MENETRRCSLKPVSYFFSRRQLARERQQKLLAEFASKQKQFMEKTLKKDPGIHYFNLLVMV